MINVRKYSLVSDQVEYPEVEVIIRELDRVLFNNIPGDVVELGCYNGTTSLFIQRLLQQQGQERSFHVYDSFSGLPQKTSEDASPAGMQFKEGELTASKQILIKNFRQAGVPLPVIHKCWFEQLTIDDIPQAIAFAFLDGDFYSSIKSSLELIAPNLSPGACVVVDDYQSEALPGAQKAVDSWAANYNLQVRAEQSLAIIYWPR